MAYALVGSIGTVAQGSVTVTPAFAQATTAGNLLIAWATNMDATASSGFGLPSGWTLAKNQANVGPYIYYKANCGAGETAPTFDNVTFGVVQACLAEFSGGATTSPLDRTADSGTIGATPKTATAAGADAASGELLITCQGWQLSKAGTDTTTDSYNNGTPTGNLNNDATSQATHYRYAYAITTANASADSDTVTDNSMNSNGGTVVLASFKLAAAAAAASLIWQPALTTQGTPPTRYSL